MKIINKYNINLEKAKEKLKNAENIIINTDGVICGTNADDTDDRLDEMCILVADNRPVKYLECIIIENKKVFVISKEEENRIDIELEECYTIE